MNAKTRFCKLLRIKSLPPPSNSRHELVSYCHSAAYTILPCKARASSGGIFCALLLGLMLGFSACSKPEIATSNPTRGGGTAPNQGVSFDIDTTWLGDTVINLDPVAP